jgi:SAM-dependent methyltransferase
LEAQNLCPKSEIYSASSFEKLKIVIAQKILDVGCGQSKQAGATGIDQIDLPGVDHVCDLNQPWPLPDAAFDQVIFRHSICHLQSLEFALREARRVCQMGGTIEIISPHFSSDNAFTDPTMTFSTGYRTMDYYCANGSTVYGYYGQLGLRINSKRIHLYRAELKTGRQRAISFLFWPFDAAANLFPRFYEKFLCFIIRANEVRFLLEAI